MRLECSETRRLRVAHITLGLEVGGQEKLLVEFARHANREQFDLQFISLSSKGSLGRQIEEQGWTIHALEEAAGLRPLLVWRIANLLREHRIDVVHTHDDRPLIYGAPAARLARVERVVHTKHYSQVPHITRRQRLLSNVAGRLVDEYVCVSQQSARLSIESGVAESRIRVIWNGIDLRRFSFAGPKKDGPAIAVARLSPEKDLATLIAATAIIVRERPDFQLLIAGDGPCREALVGQVRQLGLQQRVTFLGERHDVPDLLAKASMFVLPSLVEGISLTLLEAMATGLPVIATVVGGNPEVVRDSETGLLVPKQQPAAIAGAVLMLVDDHNLCLRLGTAARKRVDQCFEVGAMIQHYERLYTSRVPRSTLQAVHGI